MAKDSIDIVLSLKDNASNALKGFIRNLDLAKKKIEEVSRAAEKANLNIKANIQAQTSSAKTTQTGTTRTAPVAVQSSSASSALAPAAIAAAGVSVANLTNLIKIGATSLAEAGEATGFIAKAIGNINGAMQETTTLNKAWAAAAEDINEFYEQMLENIDNASAKINALTNTQKKTGTGISVKPGTAAELTNVKNAAEGARNALEKPAKKPGFFGPLLNQLKPLIALFGIINTFNVGSKFEDLKAQLKTVVGDAKTAENVFRALQQVNKQLPETLDQVTTAYIRLANAGIQPTEAVLMSFSNTASATGKDIMQYTEAVIDASVGEFERLKEFGIRVSSEKDSYLLRFKGQAYELKGGLNEVVSALIAVGQSGEISGKKIDGFAGAATERVKTLNGRLSNVIDSFQDLQAGIMSGFGGDIANLIFKIAEVSLPILNAAAQGITNTFREMKSVAVDAFTAIGEASNVDVSGGWDKFYNSVMYGIKNIDVGFRVLGIVIGDAFGVGMLNARGFMTAAAAFGLTAFGALATNIGIKFINMFSRVRNAWGEFMSEVSSFFGSDAPKFNPTPIFETVDALDAATAAWNKEWEATNKSIEILGKASQKRLDAAKATLDSRDAQEKATTSTNILSDATSKLAKNTEKGTKELTGYAKFWKELIESLKEHTNQLEWAKRAQEELNRAKQQGRITEEEYQIGLEKTNEILHNGLRGSEKYYADLIKTEKDHTKQVEYAWDAQTKLDEAFQNGKISSAEYQRAIEKTKDDIGVLRDETEKSADAMNEFMLEAARSMQNAFSDFFFDIMQGKFDDLAGSFKRTLDRMVADFLASQLATFLFGNYGKTGSIGGVLGGLFSGGSSLFSGLFKAEGGPTKAGTPYIVGEKGPELFVPRVSGNIIPNGAISSTGGTNNVSISITAMDSQSVLQALGKVKREAATMFNVTNRTYNLGVT